MDILVILLIFFVVTTTFKENKNLFTIDLPQATALNTKSDNQKRTSITVTPDLEIYLGDKIVTLESLTYQLSELKKTSPDTKLQLDADNTIPLGFLVSIWNSMNEAGYQIKEAPARILTEKSRTP